MTEAMLVKSAPGIGHNQPPIAVEVREKNKDLFDRMAKLEASLALVPEEITNDDDEGKAQDLHTSIRKTLKAAEAAYKVDKEPHDLAIKAIKATFTIPMEKIEKVGSAILSRIDVYKDKKATAEKRRREEEAEKQRLAAEAAAKAAEEAEKKRVAAEEARKAEERKAEEARQEKERQLQAARDAEERARKAKEEEKRLETERKARLEREEHERRDRAAQAEIDVKADEERKVREQAEREEHERQMAEAKKLREEEERKAEEARASAKKATEDRRVAEDAAKAAGATARTAGREEKAQMGDAVRFEKRADRLDDSAEAPASEMSRGRGEYGSVGSLATRWTWRMVDRDKVPIQALRPFINPDAMDAAITRFMQAHRPQLIEGDSNTTLLPGVVFEQITSTRIAG